MPYLSPRAEALGWLVSYVFRMIDQAIRQPPLIPVETVLATGESTASMELSIEQKIQADFAMRPTNSATTFEL